MNIAKFRKLLHNLAPGLDTQGKLRLDKSNEGIELPLQNLPVHGPEYHSGSESGIGTVVSLTAGQVFRIEVAGVTMFEVGRSADDPDMGYIGMPDQNGTMRYSYFKTRSSGATAWKPSSEKP